MAEIKRFQVSQDIRLNRTQHTALVEHIETRLQYGNSIREDWVLKLEGLDKELAGHVKLDQDDKKRALQNKTGENIKPVDISLPLALVQIDDAVTYIMSVIAPDEGMYSAVTDPSRQEIAQGFARYMNEQAGEFGHYTNVARAIRDMFVYNFGGFIPSWRTIRGNVISQSATGGPEIKKEDIFSGNHLEAIDPYNVIWDITTSPIMLSNEGEFFATIKPRSKFKVARMTAAGQMFNTEDLTRKEAEAGFSVTYYKARPTIHAEGTAGDSGGTGEESFDSILTGGQFKEVASQYEQIDYYGWINPSNFGLSREDEQQIWRITLMTDKRIVAAEHLTNAHEKLPIGVGMPWDDGFNLRTRSFADLLISLNRFASFQMNVHQRAARKALYGTTWFDVNAAPLTEHADMAGAKIPVKMTGRDTDIRRAVHQTFDVPNTDNTIRDISSAAELMQKILPTDILNNVTNLQRATQYQAAATVQGSNRRPHKITKMINDQAFVPVRGMMMMNVQQFGDEIEVMDDSGNTSSVKPAELRDNKIRFSVSQGLKGIDRLIVVEGYKELIGMMLQSQNPNIQGIDMIQLIDYWADLVGDHTDLNAFKFKTEFDALPPEGKQQAFKLLQQALAQAEAQGEGVGA